MSRKIDRKILEYPPPLFGRHPGTRFVRLSQDPRMNVFVPTWPRRGHKWPWMNTRHVVAERVRIQLNGSHCFSIYIGALCGYSLLKKNGKMDSRPKSEGIEDVPRVVVPCPEWFRKNTIGAYPTCPASWFSVICPGPERWDAFLPP